MPLRGANAILNFHFDFLTTSLSWIHVLFYSNIKIIHLQCATVPHQPRWDKNIDKEIKTYRQGYINAMLITCDQLVLDLFFKGN